MYVPSSASASLNSPSRFLAPDAPDAPISDDIHEDAPISDAHNSDDTIENAYLCFPVMATHRRKTLTLLN